MGDMGTAAVELLDVTRALPLASESIQILRGVSFRIETGEWVAVTGPSGSGKSTLLGLIAGLDTPSSGAVIVSGRDITNLDEAALARVRNEQIGIVFQSFNLIGTLTALENVEAPLHVSRKRGESRALAVRALERVGLGDRLGHRPHQLSGGQQQRVAIARAIVTQPALLVADEPTGNLDRATGGEVLALFDQLRADLGITVVVVTHDPEVAARADRTIHIVDGRLAEPAWAGAM
ncbi:MAG TPA: ABC transporter ATP-binding protein [Longimicrobiales bacterium]